MWWLALLACTSDPVETDDTTVIGAYSVDVRTDPEQPIAGETTEVWLTVNGPDGEPVPDLQQTHERMIHTFAISKDLAWFSHPHQEDFEPVTGEDLQNATFHFPLEFPAGGDAFLAFNFAHRNEYLRSAAWLNITGEPAQLDAPLFDFATTTQEVEGLTITWVWDDQKGAGEQSVWHLEILEGDQPVTDIGLWLASDGHIAVVSEDLASVGHTHAYVPGMEDVPPGHEMPHTYDGPELPFRYVFPTAGSYRVWTQFARTGQDPVTVAFDIQVP